MQKGLHRVIAQIRLLEISRRLIASFFLSTPRVLNIALTLWIAPLFFKLWGDDYAFYLTVGIAASFASIVAQPVVNKYYERITGDTDVASALLAYFTAYLIALLPVLGIFALMQDSSPIQVLSIVLFPLFVGALLVVRASYIKFSRQRISAITEALFLVIKIPCGYLLAAIDILPNVTAYTFYFSVCCAVEVWVLLTFASDKTRMLSKCLQRVKVFYRSDPSRFLLSMAIVVTEVSFGNIDRIVLSSLHRPNDLVLYTFSLTAATVLYLLPSQINAQSLSVFYRLASEREAWRLILKNWLDLAVVTIVPFFIFLSFGKWAIDLWLGQVLTPEDILIVYQCTAVLMGAAVINCMCTPLINFLQSRGQFKQVWISTALSLVVFSCGLIVVVYGADIIYAAIVAAISQVSKFILVLKASYKQSIKRCESDDQQPPGAHAS